MKNKKNTPGGQPGGREKQPKQSRQSSPKLNRQPASKEEKQAAWAAAYLIILGKDPQ